MTLRRHRGVLAALLSLLMLFLGLPSVASAEPNDGEITVESYVTGHQGSVPTVTAGTSFSLTVNMQCSSPDTGKCLNTTNVITLPAPLVFADDPLNSSPDVATGTVSGDKLTVTFADGGLEAGQLVTLNVKVQIPANASGNLDGDTVKVGLNITSDNADPVSDSISVKLDIPAILGAKTTKQVNPSSLQPALPGRPVSYTIGAANTSNVSVDTLEVAEPTNPATTTPFTYLAVTDLRTLTPPEGADRVLFQWYTDADGWTDAGTGPVAIPADPSTLLPADPSVIKGMRFTFTKDGGLVQAGNAGTIVVDCATRSNAFDDLASGASRTIANQASTIVSYAGDVQDDQASASLTFKKTPVEVTTTKSITGDTLNAGASTIVTIDAVNGIMPVSELQIDEPAAGSPDLAEQGLVFSGFVTSGTTDQKVEWPHQATSVEVTYTYTDGTTETLTGTTVDAMPAPDAAKAVKAFSAKFRAPGDGIVSGANARLAFQVTAGAVSVEAGTTASNTTKATVTDSNTTSGSDTSTDTVQLLPQRVRADVDKVLSRQDLWAVPGSTMNVSLTGRLSQQSTAESDYLTITDSSTAFWDSFDLSRILATDIPSNADLTVEYLDATTATWSTLTTQVGPQANWTYTPSNPSAIAGIRFRFTPKAGTQLPVGFNVAPRMEVKLRSVLRSDPLTSTRPDVSTQITNTVTAEVHNDTAIVQTATKDANATVTLRPTTGGGGGAPDLITKRWLGDGGLTDEDQVYALSRDTRTARLSWGTDGLAMSSMTVTDDPRDLTGSAYDAFDLVSIAPITTSTDALIYYDKVSAVKLLTVAGTWNDITSTVCSPASACDGKFPGYTLTAAERADTRAVQLTFAPGSHSATGSVAISSSSSPSRTIQLSMRLRNTLRSNPSAYVLGDSHDYTYNTGVAGVVSNAATALGVLTTPAADGTTEFEDADGANTVIYDRPLNISASKTFDQDRIGRPQAGTAQADFPLVTSTLVATNNTASFVPEITISDPSPEVSGLGAYDYLNLHQIQSLSLPNDLTASDVNVTLKHADNSTSTLTLTAAEALTPAQLSDVVGVTVQYGAMANMDDDTAHLIDSGGQATLALTYQLRTTVRSTGLDTVPIEKVTNSAQAAIVSPGGMGCVGGSSCDTPTASVSDYFGIVQPTFTVDAAKSISPSSRYEDQSGSYTVSMSGQPTGTARAKLMSFTDITPTFWNAFELSNLPQLTLPAPVNQLKVDALTGVDFAYDGATNTLSYTCGGSTVLDACWHEGSWAPADGNGTITPTLPAGITASQVRGIRFWVQSVSGGSPVQWERPATPVVGIRFDASRLTNLRSDRNGQLNTTPVPSTRPGMALAPGETAQGRISNSVIVTGTAAWLNNAAPFTDTKTDDASTDLLHRINQIKVEKTPGQGTSSAPPRYDLNETIPFQLKITNTGAWNITGLKVSDQTSLSGASTGLIPATDVTSVFTFKVNGTTAAGFSASLDQNTGDLAITVPDGFVLTAGSVLLITANLKFRDLLAAGTEISNSVTATSDRTFEKCDYSVDAIAQATQSDVTTCSSSTRVTVAASTPMTVAKAVRGIGAGDPTQTSGQANYDDLGVIAVGATNADACPPDSDGFYSAGCVPITRPGGTERWRLTLANGGNVAANKVVAIDVLPALGDTGVTVGTARKSRFTPTFVGNVQLTLPGGTPAHSFTTYYATSAATPACNKSDILAETSPTPPSDCGLTWTEFDDTTPAAILATAAAVKFVLSFDSDTTGIIPGGQFKVTFDTVTPRQTQQADATTVEPVAWNSAAIGSRTARVPESDTSPEFPPRASLITEPRKSGVAIASGRVDLNKTVSLPADAAWTNALPASYPGTLSCESLGTPVTLTGALASTDTSKVTLAGVNGNGTSATVNYNVDGSSTLPLFATCSFTENAAQGAAPSYSPTEVVAQHGYTGIANIGHPWAGHETPLLGVTNTYSYAGFTVTKDVTGPAAKDENGQPVSFKDFTYTASCKLNGTEVIPTGQRSFTLRDGDTATFEKLPAGATCSVQETYAGSAAETSVVVTGGSDASTSGSTADFTLVTGDATATSLAYTNRFTVGATKLTKTVVDPTGLWGGETFVAHLSCTHPDATTPTVYDGDITVSAAAPVTVSNLATGASCTVTEPQTGGANSAAITGGTFTVGDDPSTPSAVGITNTFTTGSVKVTKTIQANGEVTSSEPWVSGAYPVTLACTRMVNGTSVSITVPHVATRTLNKANSFTTTYTDLPTGATCSVTEDGAGSVPGQPDPTVTITDPVTVGNATTANIGVTNNFRAGKLQITKSLTGVGTSFFTTAKFGVSCTLDSQTVFTASNVAVTNPSLTSAVLGPIPFGASCQVSETDTGGADATPGANTVVITKDDATSDVNSTTFQNAFSAGTVTVSKVLTGDAAGASWATSPNFSMAVKCGKAAAGPYSYDATVQVKGGQSVQLKDGNNQAILFPYGTHCWASETGTNSAVSATVDNYDFDHAAQVAASPESVQGLGITATNEFTYAGFTVTKDVVTSGAKDQSGSYLTYSPTFAFTASCTFNGSTVLTDTFTLSNSTSSASGTTRWGEKTYDHLPTGAVCTVTETGTGSATSTGIVVKRTGQGDASVSGTTTSFALVKGDVSNHTGDIAANVAAVTNTYGIGNVTITKALDVSTTPLTNAAKAWAYQPFTVRLTCTSTYAKTSGASSTIFDDTVTMSWNSTELSTLTSSTNKKSSTISLLPSGASCAVSETVKGGANSTTYTNQNPTVGNGTTVISTVTNGFTQGTAKVQKLTRAGTPGSYTDVAGKLPWSNTQFAVTLTCVRDIGGSNETITKTGTITGASSQSWSMPTSASCTVAETGVTYPSGTPTQPDYTVVVSGTPTVISGTSTYTLNVTNYFAYGNVQATKTVDGDGATLWGGGTFTFGVTCTMLQGSTPTTVYTTTLTAKRTAGNTFSSATSGPIPVGSTCTLNETNTAGATSTTPSPATVTVDTIDNVLSGGSTKVAAFTNTYKLTGFTVTKTVDNGGAKDTNGLDVKYTSTYDFSASCTYNNGVSATATALAATPFSLKDGESRTFSDLPVGASCTVTESGTANANSVGYTITKNGTGAGSGSTASTSAFTLVRASDDTANPGATVVGFTNHYTTGGLDITKATAGAGKDVWDGGTFTMHAICTLSGATNNAGGSEVYNQTQTLLKGEVWQIRNLPNRASCALTEDKVAGANVTAISTPSPTIGNGTNTAITVTNTFRTGSVSITKALKVNGQNTAAEPWNSATYQMTLSCAKDFNSDGTAETLDLNAVLGAGYATKTVTGPGTATWSGLPEGAVCGVTEGTITYPAGTPAQPAPSSVTSSGQVAVGNATTQPVTITNAFDYGTVQITKELAGAGVTAWGGAPYTFDVACTLAGSSGSVFSASGITLQRSGSETTLTSALIGPIPQGAACTATETSKGWATSVSPSLTQSFAAIEATKTAGVTFTNNFDLAGFTVRKAVSTTAVDAAGNPVHYTGAYAFTASCKIGAQEFLNAGQQSFTLTDGTSQTITGLPTGANCTVTETNTRGAVTTTTALNQTGHSQVDGTGTTASFTLVAGDQTANTVTYTNGYTTGGLDITKATNGTGAAAWGGGDFTVKAVCTLDADGNAGTAEVEVYNGTHVLKATETWALRLLPTGAHCTVSETKSAGANATAIDVPSPTITTANQAVKVTNTFNAGSLRVTKAITANGTNANALAPWSSGSYPVTISCTKDFNNDGTAETLDLNAALGAGFDTKTITGAGNVTWSGLPQGATCTATEGTTVVAGQNQPTTATIGSTAIGSGTTAALTLTNAFAAGKLVIHKDITGAANTTWGTGPFTFDVTCTQTGFGTVFSRSGITLTPTVGQTSLDSAALGPIPFTASCTATETSAAGATDTTSPGAVTISENAATGDVTTATFTNRFDYAGFTVTKAVSSAATDNTGTLITYKPASFTATCTFKGSEAITNVADRTFTLAAGASKKFENLPAGASCTVTETNAQGAASTAVSTVRDSATLDSGTKTATTFTVAHSDVTTTATTATFTNSYTTGSAAITKTVTGSGGSLWGAGPFTVKLVCTSTAATSATVYSDVHDLIADQTWTVSNLPTNASCTVTEEKAAGANSTTITPATFIVGTTSQAVSVTNTFTTGAVKVTKALTANGTLTTATPWTDGTYQVKLACTRPYNGSPVAITVPGGDTRDITGDGYALYEDLPTGATCSATEVSSSPTAASTAVSAAVTVGNNPSSPQAITVTNDFHTRTMTIAKQLEGAGQASFGNGPFTFDVACTLPVNGTNKEVFDQSGISLTRTVSTDTVLHSSTIGPIPVGATCTVTETDRGGADTTPDPVTLVITDDAAANVAGISNQFSAGTVYVNKVLAGAAKDEAWATGATFDVLVTCKTDTGSGLATVFSNTVSLKGGDRVNALDGSGDPSRVPLGSRCWASETDSQGATSVAVDHTDWDHAAIVTAGTPSTLQELELTATNTYSYAGFTVSKQVSDSGAVDADGNDLAHTGTFGFDADCTFNGSSVLDKSFTLAHTGGSTWASQDYIKLPAGAACTVVESGSAAADQTGSVVTTDGVAGTPTSGTTASFVLARGSALFSEDAASVNAVAFTNTYKVGSLTVTKVIDGAGADAWGNTSFDVAVACTADLDANATTPDDEVYAAGKTLTKAAPIWQIDDLVAGASCTVTETAWGGATVHPSPQVATVVAEVNTPVTVTNSFAVGSIQVTKAFTVDGSEPAKGWAGQLSQASATVSLTCSRDVNGTTTAVDVPNGATRTLTAANSFTATYDGLPAGATCQLAETASSPVANTVSYSDDAPVVPSSDTADVTVTNDYHTGTLTIDKVVTGPGAAYGVGPFTFSVSCSLSGLNDPVYTNDSVSLTAPNLSSTALGPIPVGAVCDVTETGAAGATTPAGDAQVTIPDSPATNNAASVTMTNEFATGALTVAKAIDNGGALDANSDPVAYPGKYRFTATCSFEGASELLGLDDQDFTLAGGDSRTITGLPMGTSCTVTESGTGNAASTTVTVGTDKPVTDTTASVTIGAEPRPITFTNKYLTGAATITKQLTGAGAEAWGAGPFVLRTRCTLDTDHDPLTDPAVVYNGTAELSSSNLVWNLTKLASGADCTVSEEAAGGANTSATDQSFTVGNDEADPSQVTMTNDFTVGSVTVTKQILVDDKVSDAEPFASGTYTMSLSCTRMVNGAAQPISVPGGATRTITGAGTATFDGLPVGADCSISESATSLALASGHVTIDQPTFTIGDKPVEVQVSNFFHTSSLQLSVTFTGVGATPFAKDVVALVDCTLDGASGSVYSKTVTISPVTGQPTVTSEVMGPIPVGAKCTITALSANGADALPHSVTVTQDPFVTVMADLTATYSAGTISVTKVVSGAGASAHRSTAFAVAVTCQDPQGAPVASGTLNYTGAGTATLNGSNGSPVVMPAGTACWASETVTGGAKKVTVDHNSLATAVRVASSSPETVQQLKITVTNEFAATENDLAFTGYALGWGLPTLGLLSIGLGMWLVGRRRRTE